jgi:hypothetical protein
MLSSMVDTRSDKRAYRGVVGAMELIILSPYVSKFSSHILLYSRGSKVGRNHGDVDSSASHSELHKTTIKVVTS